MTAAEVPHGTATRTTTDVPHGCAEQLARLAHFRSLETTQPEEMDEVAHWLLAQCGVPVAARADLWERLQDAADALWHLITDDWSADDLDELTDAEWERASFATQQQEEDRRYELTRARLCIEIDAAIWLARYHAPARHTPAVTA